MLTNGRPLGGLTFDHELRIRHRPVQARRRTPAKIWVWRLLIAGGLLAWALGMAWFVRVIIEAIAR
jgi:hypothetical protein